ncbi:twin-arginine translocase TatA/TatE family subunit [Candidatus Nitrospira salsa]
MFGSFGWMELLLILFIVLIIFGAGKIPQLGEGLGKAIKGFKKSVNEPEINEPTEISDPREPMQHEGQQSEGLKAEATHEKLQTDPPKHSRVLEKGSEPLHHG